MPTVTRDDTGGVTAAVTRRWRAIDPLLPAPSAPSGGCGAELSVTGPDGQPTAIGFCEHWHEGPGSMKLTWGAARRFRLTAHAAGPAVAGALDELLSRWQAHLAAEPEAGADDTAATVMWPSRDIDGPLPLLRHGLAPRAVIAARPAGRATVPAAAAPEGPSAPGPADPAGPASLLRPGVRIRRAGPADIEAVVGLGMATIRFDAHFGTVIERPWSAEGLRGDASALLAEPGPWTWLAEDNGHPVAMLYAEPPAAAGWIAPMTGLSPVAYLELIYVQPDDRGQGTGPALVGQLHQEADAAGLAATLLHYEQVNPLSGPFWSRQGYRPLWTSWEARPARTLR
jgi:GNAT superfamily N-acetyltransferase